MKVSIITATQNNAATIEQCMNSIHNQSYQNIEHIIIDDSSTDETLKIIGKYDNTIIVSEPDNGIYDALNKGLRIATGGIIGILHADDFYANDRIIDLVVSEMTRHKVDSCYGDLIYVNRANTDKTVRYWKSCSFEENLFQRGWMPPHPTFFVRKEGYGKYGGFETSYKIAADYELMLRFLKKHKISTHYIPEVLIKMRVGGASNKNLKNIIIKTTEDYRAWKDNDASNNFYPVLLKNLSKISQFFKRY